MAIETRRGITGRESMDFKSFTTLAPFDDDGSNLPQRGFKLIPESLERYWNKTG
jgi:hypothetical protein